MSKDSGGAVSSIPWEQLKMAAQVDDRAVGLTHSLYRYPASMSPALVRALIVGLTKPGDTVLDPFCGGGTTAIEALAHNRNAICADLNSLACFVTRAKATRMSRAAMRAYEAWADEMGKNLQSTSGRTRLSQHSERDFSSAPHTHSLLLAMRDSARRLPNLAARRFALLVVLRAAQICFDRTRNGPFPAKLARAFEQVTSQAPLRMGEYAEACDLDRQGRRSSPSLRVLNCDAAELAVRLQHFNERVSLIVTSPPYPGVHMLYHRWQIHGRRETSLPYLIIGQPDGRFESAYTLGSRSETDNATYFKRLEGIYSAIHDLIEPTTLVAQVVAFPKPRQQLPHFRKVMSAAGFDEILAPELANRPVTRTIPNRRWYALLSENQNAATEYVLIHRPRPQK